MPWRQICPGDRYALEIDMPWRQICPGDEKWILCTGFRDLATYAYDCKIFPTALVGAFSKQKVSRWRYAKEFGGQTLYMHWRLNMDIYALEMKDRYAWNIALKWIS